MSAPLSEFTTILNAQGPAWLGGPEDVVADVAKQTFTLPHLMAGKINEVIFQGGDRAEAMVNLELSSTFTRYNPNPTINYGIQQPGQKLGVEWAYAYAYIGYTKQEIGLNKDFATKKARAQRYTSVMFLKKQNYTIDVANSMEEEYWATPDNATMEAATVVGVRKPYSLPCFISEWPDTLPLGFTTVEGISPTTYTNWKNQQVTYGEIDVADSGSSKALFGGFKRLRQSVQFDKLPKDAQYSEGVTRPEVYFTSSWGDRLFERAMLDNNQNFYGGGGPGRDAAYDTLVYHRVPVTRITQLDGASLYRNAGDSANATEAAANNTGPRYYAANCRYIFPFFHAENYGQLGSAMTPTAQPFSVVQLMDLWNNTGCQSRKRQGILSPSADTTLEA